MHLTPKKLKEVLTNSIKSDIPHLILGTPGSAKSEIVSQVAEKLGYNLVDWRLSQMEASDLSGIPYIKKGIMKWSKLDGLPYKGDKIKKPTLLFLDELLQATPPVMTAAFKLIWDRKTANFDLHPDLRIVAAANNFTDQSGTYTPNLALLNRFAISSVRIEPDEWIEWAIGNKVDPLIISFIHQNPEYLNTFDTDKIDYAKPDTLVFATPRRWVELDKNLKVDPTTKSDFATLEANVGIQVAAAFKEYITHVKDLPDNKEIIKNPNIDIPKANLISLSLLAFRLAQFTKDKNVKPITKFISRWEPEIQMLYVTSALQMDVGLISNKHYRKIADKLNADIGDL